MSDHQLPNPEARSRPRIAPGWVGRLLVPSHMRALTLSEDALEVDGLRRSQPLAFLSLRDLPVLREGRVWSTIAVTIGDTTYELRGLNRAQARHFIAVASTAIKTSLTAAGTRHRDYLQRLAGELTQLSLCFCRQSQLNDWLPRLNAMVDMLTSSLLRSYSDDDTRVAIDRLKAFLDDPEGTRKELNDAFVGRELAQYQHFFDTVERQPLTPMQRLACVVHEDRNLVLAGAGSGKPSVIVGRAGYLVESGQARPAEVLILAFGHKASQETDERIGERLPGTPGISAHTFHALGRKIIGQATGRMPALSTLAEDPEVFSRYLLETVQQLSKENNGYGHKVLHFLATYLQPYKPPDAFDSHAAYVRYLTAVDIRTLRGEQIKSQEEVAIANFLTLGGITYEYEAYYQVDTATPTHARYRPDFYLPEYDLYIEHFAIDEQGRTPSFINQTTYAEGIAWKRALHQEYHTTLIETYSSLFRDGRLFDELERQLTAHGVAFQLRALEEVLAPHADRRDAAHQLITLMETFLTVFKSSGKDMADLRRDARAAKDGRRALGFLDVFALVLRRYTQELRAKHEIDFDDMITEAVRHLDSGRYRSPFWFILVDEFQDISVARAHLLQALLRSRPDTTLFCVGDDWQSIFRFTGSDQLVLPDEEPFPFAEERRLFYVAVTRARHHSYILSDISAPSVFVTEMPDGRHTDYEFHHLVTEGGLQEQAAVVRCPNCDGWFERKSSPSGEFYGCRNYPYCEERASRCERCGTMPLVRQTHTYVCANTACRHT